MEFHYTSQTFSFNYYMTCENNEWLHPRAIERQNELPLYEEKKAVD